MVQEYRQGGWLFAAVLVLCGSIPAQESPPGPEDAPPLEDLPTSIELGDFVLLPSDADVVVSGFIDGITIIYPTETGPIEMRADRALVWAPVPRNKNQADDPLHIGPRIPPPTGGEAREGIRGSLSPTVDHALGRLREIYLEGNVFWRRGDDSVLFADRLYYDFVEERGVITNGRLIAETTRERKARSGRARELRVYSLQVRAEELRMRGLNGLDIVNGEFSTCTFGEPHYHIQTEQISIDFESDPEDPSRRGDIRINSEGNRLKMGDTTVLPLPNFSFTADAGEGTPLQKVQVGRSSQLGAYLQTEWRWNTRKAGRRLHRWLGIEEDFDGGFELQVDAMSRRGPGLGPSLDYKAEGRYFGEIGTYFVQDRADEDFRRLSRREPGGQGDPFRFDIEQPLRGRVYTRNRFFLSEAWNLDLESHWFTDAGFQNEYLEREAKEAKEPESYAHLVRQSGTTRFRALYRNRLNDFDTQLDSLPRLSFDQVSYPLLPTPLFGDRGGTLILDQFHEVGSFRRNPADGINLRSASVTRADSVAEFSSPFELGPVGIRPFASGRYTVYGDTVNDGSSLARFAARTGARAQLPFHRDYNVLSDRLQIDGLRHVLILDVGYENTWLTNKDPTRFEQLDPVDAVDKFQQYLVGVRQRLQTWRGNQVQDFLRLDLELPLFPREDRDNPVGLDSQGLVTGQTAGPLRFDLQYIPGFTFPGLEGTRLIAEGEWDVNDKQLAILNTGIAVRPRNDLWTRLSYRVARGRSRVITASSDWRLTEKWSSAMLVQHDIRENQVLEQRLNLRRHGHDFIFDLTFARDAGENNTTFSINLRPVLFRAKARDRSLYERNSNPDLVDDFDRW